MSYVFEDSKPALGIGGYAFEDEKPSGGGVRRVGDVGISLLKGAIGVPEAAVGIADIATGGRVGKIAESAGFRPKEAKSYLDEYLSPEQQAANKAVSDTKGFLPTVGVALKNPSTIGHAVLESLPVMGAGGVLGRSLVGAGAKPYIAGAIGEGVVSGGLAAEQIRQETPTGLLDPKQSGAALASGIGTAAFGAAGGKLAQKLKIADVDTMLAGGQLVGKPGQSAKGFARRLTEGAISEGVFEELPQSLQEQMWQNYATDKPIMDGVAESGAMGMLAGGVMGGVAGGLFKPKAAQPAPAKLPDSGPMSRTVNAGVDSGAAEVAPTEGRLFPLTAEGASRRMELLGQNGQPQRIIPHPEREGRFAVIPDEYGTAIDDQGRIAALMKEAETIIGALPEGRPLTKLVVAHLSDIDSQIASLRDTVAIDAEKAQGKSAASSKQDTAAAMAEKQKQADRDQLARASKLPAALYDAEYANTIAQKSGALDVAEMPTAMQRAFDKARGKKQADQAPSAAPGPALPAPEQEAIPSQPVSSPAQTRAKAAPKVQPAGSGETAVAVPPPPAPVKPSGPVLQNRNRTTRAYIVQMNEIAGNPDPARLSFSRDFLSGAPAVIDGAAIPENQLGKRDRVVTSSGRQIPVRYAVVEADTLLPSNSVDGAPVEGYTEGVAGKFRVVAGNGRTAGVQAAYARKSIGEYAAGIAEDVGLHGISAAAMARMTKPVLVRVMPESEVTDNIGDETNTTATADLSPAEKAGNDARRIDLVGLEVDENGVITREAMRQFVEALPDTERAGLVDQNGVPTRQAQDRLTNAVFMQAYGDADLVSLQSQASDPEARTVMTALVRAAPIMARLEDAGDLDIRSVVIEAAKAAINAKKSGISLQTYAAQGDLTLHADSAAILRFFADNVRSTKKISDGLIRAATTAAEQAGLSATDMFGAVPRLSRASVLGGITNDTEGQENVAERGGRVALDENVGRQASEQARPGSDQSPETIRPAPAEEVTPLALTGETPAEVRTREAKEQAAAEAKVREEAKPAGPNVRADQVDLFNEQGGFDFRNATTADSGKPLSEIIVNIHAIEAETGKKLAMTEKADIALRDVDEQLSKARMLLQCLKS